MRCLFSLLFVNCRAPRQYSIQVREVCRVEGEGRGRAGQSRGGVDRRRIKSVLVLWNLLHQRYINFRARKCGTKMCFRYRWAKWILCALERFSFRCTCTAIWVLCACVSFPVFWLATISRPVRRRWLLNISTKCIKCTLYTQTPNAFYWLSTKGVLLVHSLLLSLT